MERLTAIRTVHSFVNEEREYTRYCAAVDASYKLARKLSIAEGVFLAGGFLVSQGTLLAGMFCHAAAHAYHSRSN
jgi:ABC-type multidrug transport system fused ATPase/permease subunit